MKTLALLLMIVTTHISLTWDHDEPQTVDHYRIEKSYTKDFRAIEMKVDTKELEYTDYPTTNVRTYYRVIAVNDYGESEPSDIAQCLPLWPPRRPVGFKLFQYAK